MTLTLDQIYLVLGTAALNGAVTWGVVKTQLDWLRSDIDRAHARISNLSNKVERYAGRRRVDEDEGH